MRAVLTRGKRAFKTSGGNALAMQLYVGFGAIPASDSVLLGTIKRVRYLRSQRRRHTGVCVCVQCVRAHESRGEAE
jgi:hypothetical protein